MTVGALSKLRKKKLKRVPENKFEFVDFARVHAASAALLQVFSTATSKIPV